MAISAAAAAAATAAATAARRVSLALTRPISSPPLPAAKRFCTTPPAPPPPPPPPPPSDGEKLDEVLKLLRSRGPETDMKGMQERVGRLEAKVYYGGVLFGILGGATVGITLLGHDVLSTFEDIQQDQKKSRKLIRDMNERLKAVEGTICDHKTEGHDITTPPTDVEGSAPQVSWVVRLLAYLKGA